MARYTPLTWPFSVLLQMVSTLTKNGVDTMQKNKITYTDFVNGIAQTIKQNIAKGAGVWVDDFDREGSALLPINSQASNYRGVNICALLMAQMENGFKSNQWLTFRQIKDLNGSVNKGEKSTLVFFFTSYDKKGVASEDKKTSVYQNGKEQTAIIKKGETFQYAVVCPKYYHVFNRTQTNLQPIENTAVINANIQTVLDKHQPKIIHHDQGSAYYDLPNDMIKMPLQKYFKTPADYQATLLHELAHFTMHPSRLNRAIDFGCRKSYAREELVAELSSVILLKHFDIQGEVQNHESYIDSYLQYLTDEDYTEAVKKSVKVISRHLS